jgi:multicomponent Na+:H+ antiporter subunit C
MTQFDVYAVTSALLFGLGLLGLLIQPHILRKILSFNIMGVGIFLFFVTIANRSGAESPDPVPQALVLTGIVVAVSATAFALTLFRRIHAETGQVVLTDARQESNS